MKAVTARQIQKLDEKAIGIYGVPSVALMENAGRGVAEDIIRTFRRRKCRRVCVICGPGNNAGDGFVTARHLLNAGVKTDIFFLGNPSKLKPDAKTNYSILKKCGYPVRLVKKFDSAVLSVMEEAGVIVDALFGVGLNRKVEGVFADVINEINRGKQYVFAVDVPSGLDATTGKIHGVCVKADRTVTFTFPKTGFYKNAGPAHAGKVVVIDIGIPEKLVVKVDEGRLHHGHQFQHRQSHQKDP